MKEPRSNEEELTKNQDRKRRALKASQNLGFDLHTRVLRVRGVVRLTQARNRGDCRSVEASAQAIGHRVLEIVELHLRLDWVEILGRFLRFLVVY
ncbi:hypothetical protein LIER_34094 [Lithospermum erythrorhizon]|uniref:Uncharacterized protein n=1 Tax=Lithospermum erythrorhizon TaxID=34254 RepID=A0AAV3S3M2_LITER